MTTKRPQQRHRTAVPQRPARYEVLAQLVTSMEPELSARHRGRSAPASGGWDRECAIVASWARTEDEASDLWRQAMLLAHWEIVTGRPLHLVQPTGKAEAPGTTRLPIPILHCAGHGIVGALVTEAPFEVGFSGFGLPRPSDAGVQLLVAGQALDEAEADAFGLPLETFVGGCFCYNASDWCIARHLGVPTSDVEPWHGSELLERIRSMGLEEHYRSYFQHQLDRATALVERARESGYVDGVATRLQGSGRIVVDPAEARVALGLAPTSPMAAPSTAHQ